MKKFMFLLLATVLCSCGHTVYQLNTDCDRVSAEELFQSITTLLMQENFLIKQNDIKLGYLQAETVPDFNVWVGQTETRIWVFQYIKGKIVASAKVVYQGQNAFGSPTSSSQIYYGDKTHSDWTWYWTIRRGIETICGNKIIIKENHVN